ncbi:MAG: response regulator [bacterium]
MVKPRKVLIVEDDQKAREEIKRAFRMDEEFEFEVSEAATVEEATEILKKERRFDVVVIDWRLESLEDGGLEVLDLMNKIKVYFPKIKIVYTAYATLENCVKAMKAGADDYIDKNQVGSLKKLLESAKEKLRARKFDDNEPDNEWLSEHFEELNDKYYGEILAFIDSKVVGHAKTKRKLMEEVKKQYPDEEPFIMYAPMEAV